MGTVEEKEHAETEPRDAEQPMGLQDVSRETSSSEATDRLELAQGILARILADLAEGCRVRVDPASDLRTIKLVIEGESAGRVIGHHGQTLDAIEHLLNRIVFKDGRPAEGRVVLDMEEYRSRREQQVTHMALQLAQRVRETGRPVAMAPMSARERRLVHLALRETTDVLTASEGEGDERHVVITPARAPLPKRRRPIY